MSHNNRDLGEIIDSENPYNYPLDLDKDTPKNLRNIEFSNQKLR